MYRKNMFTLQNRAVQLFTLLLFVFLFAACENTQDDIKLPVLDAIGGDFTLPSTLGRDVSLSEYHGKVVLLNFGFTSCPDVCPMVLSRLDKLNKNLQEQHSIGTEKVQTLFITVDPERDSIEHLKKYLEFFNSAFIGLSGSLQQTDKVTKQYAAFFEKQAIEANGDYRVIHNDRIFLIDKRGRLRALFAQSDKDEKIIDAVVSLVQAGL